MGMYEKFANPIHRDSLTASEFLLVQELDALANSSAGQFLRKVSGTIVNDTPSGGGGTWGSITGTLANQTDLQSALNLKDSILTFGDNLTRTANDVDLDTTIIGLVSVTSTTFVGALTGNASTATVLETARTIGGVSFNGSANITVASATGGFTVSGGVAVLGSAPTMTSPDITTSITTPSTTFTLLNATATTVNAFGATTTLNIGASATLILNFGGSTTASEFRFLEPSGSGTNFTAFKAVAMAANITYSLPAAVGGAGTFLTDAAGNGVLSWAVPAGAGDVSKVGTPVNNQIGVWTGDGTIEGDAALTFDTTTDTLSTVDISLSNDLLIALAGVINFDSGDITITHSANTLTIAGGNLVSTLGAITLAGIMSGGGQQLNNIIIGTVTPLAGTFTTLTVNTGVTLAENTSIALDPAGSADGKYSGTTVTGTSGYTQAFGDCVYLDPTDSRWEACDANAAAGADGDSRGIVGIVVVAGTDGNSCTILLNGIIRADAKFPTFTVNNPIYVSETAGVVTQTQPATTDNVIRICGFALTADEMYWNPENDYITRV